MAYLSEGIALARDAVDRGEIPGAVMAFTDGSSTEYAHAGFKARLPEYVPLQEDTLYDVASLTKVVATTTMALKLMEDGAFTLETRLQELLPDFPHSQVTVQHILTHTSGILADDKSYKQCSDAQSLWEFLKKKPLCFVPGTQVEYSDFGYIALGRAIERLTGNMEEYAQAAIFRPLDMAHTLYNPAEKGFASDCAPTEYTAERGLIQGVVHDGKAWRMGGVSGNAGLFSNIRDLSRFARMLLGYGTLDGTRVLHRSSAEQLLHCYTQGLNLRRTLGWFCDEPTASHGSRYSRHCLYHTGFTGTSMYVDFDRQCAFILLTNRVHPSRENSRMQQLRKEIHDAVLLSYDCTTQNKGG